MQQARIRQARKEAAIRAGRWGEGRKRDSKFKGETPPPRSRQEDYRRQPAWGTEQIYQPFLPFFF
jgi:hypothetical protein